jgi:BASS family bile acid:Na+ symporter
MMGNIAGRFAQLSLKDLRAVTIESGIQNSGLGLILIFNNDEFIKYGGMAFVAAWWGIWHIISGMGLAYYWNRTDDKNA